ncbi:hypothetical protein FRC00_006497, partial [Tulasnella sp. 408]
MDHVSTHDDGPISQIQNRVPTTNTSERTPPPPHTCTEARSSLCRITSIQQLAKQATLGPSSSNAPPENSLKTLFLVRCASRPLLGPGPLLRWRRHEPKQQLSQVFLHPSRSAHSAVRKLVPSLQSTYHPPPSRTKPAEKHRKSLPKRGSLKKYSSGTPPPPASSRSRQQFPVLHGAARSKKIIDTFLRKKNNSRLDIRSSSKPGRMQHRQQQTGGSIPRSTASAAPSSASSSTTGTWHPCIESDMYHIVNRHAASPETVEKRRAILATLQEATGSITAWKVIDVSPWTYSFETEESVLQVALAQPYDPLSGETAAATPPEHRQKKRPSRKSPNLRPLESVLQGISPYLQIPTDSETRLPDPVECTIEGIEFDLLPPSPLHAPLNAFLNAYRWHYQPLHALLPFFDLWVRSWDVEPGELSPA